MALGADVVIDVIGVSKSFGTSVALRHIDLRVQAGSVHGLLGPNGAGKTTLLAVLYGLVHPDEGVVKLFGRPREAGGREWLRGVGGFVETPRFYPYLTGRQNLEVLAALDVDAFPVDDALALVGLHDAGRKKFRGYSLGMRQRLGLAAALLRRPRLLILDEPTNGMDPAGIRDLLNALTRLAGMGLAVLLSSHDIEQVGEICDAVTVLNNGAVAYTGSLESMRALAPNPTWRLMTSNNDAALLAARSLESLEVVLPRGDGRTDLGFDVIGDQARLDDYVLYLGRLGIAVRELSKGVSALESLFFGLTEDQSGAPSRDVHLGAPS